MTPIDRARELKDTRFLHLGRDRNGIDCIGLVAYAEGYPAEKIPPYGRDPVDGLLERQLDAALGTPLGTFGTSGAEVSDLLPGDVIALAYGKPIRHVALVGRHPTLPGQLTMIHTDSNLGKVTEHILDAKWLRRVRRVYRP